MRVANGTADAVSRREIAKMATRKEPVGIAEQWRRKSGPHPSPVVVDAAVIDKVNWETTDDWQGTATFQIRRETLPPLYASSSVLPRCKTRENTDGEYLRCRGALQRCCPLDQIPPPTPPPHNARMAHPSILSAPILLRK